LKGFGRNLSFKPSNPTSLSEFADAFRWSSVLTEITAYFWKTRENQKVKNQNQIIMLM